MTGSTSTFPLWAFARCPGDRGDGGTVEHVDRRFLRPGWMVGHLLVLAAVLTCLRLGVWQWDRTQETTGTAQNFGYAVLWPAFGIAFVYMWIKFLKLEQIKDQEDDAELTALAAGPQGLADATDPGSSDAADDAAPVDPSDTARPGTPVADEPSAGEPSTGVSRRRRSSTPPVTLSAAEVPSEYDDDPELTAYNQALAALAEEDRRRG